MGKLRKVMVHRPELSFQRLTPSTHDELLHLGSGLTAAGEAVNETGEHLRRVAAAYGAPRGRVGVFPTYLVVALEPGRPATLTVGIRLILQPTWGDLALAALLGAFVGMFKPVGTRWASIQMITPVIAASAKDAVAGLEDFLSAVNPVVAAIALGVLCGYPLYRSLARSLGWIQELGSA